MAKDIVILGGPNGAGKTTAARQLLPDRLGIGEFVNADEIAFALSPHDPDAAAVTAGRRMIERMRSLSVLARVSSSKQPAPAGLTSIFCADAGQKAGA